MVASAAAGELPQDFVKLADVAPGVEQDMRYAGPDNFTGKPAPGYASAQCWLRADAAHKLVEAQADAHRHGFDLVVYDCYRPRRAVAAFVAWSQQDADQTTKDRYYPNVQKRELFAQGYIAEKSSHSTGLAVDIAIKGRDFGTLFDYFDKQSWTASADVPAKARQNRQTLEALMRRHGFANYPREWWHFTLDGARDAESFDTEIK
ncbi:MAG: M15 family metallopeptidase [Methylocystis sp.]|nr:M15 family metallopeptidase [Methylocystis sp.]MBI3276103.1 M15 family metallopeptidase [Methylocystis sp.]